MIRCKAKHLQSRCRQRGYTLEEVRPCIVSEDGDWIVVDEQHEKYPRTPRARSNARPATPSRRLLSGAGTELKNLLKVFGFTASKDCKCRSRADLMDRMGIEWCEANIDRIVGYLREAAADRGLPFLDAAGRLLVKRAIRNARKAQETRLDRK